MLAHAAVVAAIVGVSGCRADRSQPKAPVDQGPDASAGEIIVPGGGSCTRDDDCVLSGYAEGIDGCCDVESTCGMYATSKTALEARKRANKCRPSTPPICPPMSPCPPAATMLDRAVCVRGTCAAIGHAGAP
jgi:hypothetical protein